MLNYIFQRATLFSKNKTLIYNTTLTVMCAQMKSYFSMK